MAVRNAPYGLSNPDYDEQDFIADYNAQSLDPNSTIIKAYRDAFFRNKPSEINERLAMVLAVKYEISIPSDLEYFGNQETASQFGTNKNWVCVICRVFDLHSSLPIPNLTAPTATQGMSVRDLTLIRLNASKFYATKEDLNSKGVPTLEPGDWVVVEFHDKSTISNGIIKDLFIKKTAVS